MTGRFLTLVLILALLFMAWKTGVVESIRSGGIPEYGRDCTVDGPIRLKGVPGAVDPESLSREIDTHVGAASSERLAVAMGLQSLFDSGALVHIPAHSKVSVIENGTVTVQGIQYKIVKITILGGKLKGSEFWIERVNLIDTPLQAFFQSLRQQQSSSPTPTPADSAVGQ